jgi:hypothetical protein
LPDSSVITGEVNCLSDYKHDLIGYNVLLMVY